jgi:hypothetical protein
MPCRLCIQQNVADFYHKEYLGFTFIAILSLCHLTLCIELNIWQNLYEFLNYNSGNMVT